MALQSSSLPTGPERTTLFAFPARQVTFHFLNVPLRAGNVCFLRDKQEHIFSQVLASSTASYERSAASFPLLAQANNIYNIEYDDATPIFLISRALFMWQNFVTVFASS
jgi:hypothetical protein